MGVEEEGEACVCVRARTHTHRILLQERPREADSAGSRNSPATRNSSALPDIAPTALNPAGGVGGKEGTKVEGEGGSPRNAKCLRFPPPVLLCHKDDQCVVRHARRYVCLHHTRLLYSYGDGNLMHSSMHMLFVNPHIYTFPKPYTLHPTP